jgi:hypothetical protein
MYVYSQTEDAETAGGRYLPATCVMLDWLRLTAVGPNAGYLALHDDDAQQALWTGVARLLNALPVDPHVRTVTCYQPLPSPLSAATVIVRTWIASFGDAPSTNPGLGSGP